MAGDELLYRCNICSTACCTSLSALRRESRSCPACGSTPRLRAIASLLSRGIFGRSMLATEFPCRRDIVGLGLSDWNVLAGLLANKFDYTNTFLHQDPKLDITDERPDLDARFDFIISSEVFEHVLPPVRRAFVNVHRMLKPGGVLICTVPYAPWAGETVEHYPRLHDYRIVERDGSVVLQNVTRSGEVEEFSNPVFHEGPGGALEMRVFTEESLLREMKGAGFSDVEVMRDPDLEFGVHWNKASRPITARRSR